jgi:hypothetical protein
MTFGYGQVMKLKINLNLSILRLLTISYCKKLMTYMYFKFENILFFLKKIFC